MSSASKAEIQRCICQICTCGRHRCPHNRGSIANSPVDRDAVCNITEYQKAFETWPYQPRRESLRPAIRARLEDVPMDIKTTYQNTYKKHPYQAEIRQVKYNYTPPQSKMNNQSTYVTEYTEKSGARPVSFKPQVSYDADKTPFSTNTMYMENFGEVSPDTIAMARSNPIKHKECIEMSSDPFDATSVMKKDFVNHENPARVGLILPKQQEKQPPSKFNSNTTYKTEYTEKSHDRAVPMAKEVYIPNDSPFSGETTAHTDYKGWPDHKREASFKPQMVYKPSEGKFENRTTASDAFKHWPAMKMEKPKWGHSSKYVPPTAPVQGRTSYQEDYVRPSSHTRTQPVKPKQNDLYFEKTPNNSKTHYQENFVGYQGHQKPLSFKKPHVYQKAQDPFLAESIYQHNYKGEQTDRAKPCGPKVNNLGASSAKLNTNTTYNDEYINRKHDECPATELYTDPEKMKANKKSKSCSFALKSVRNGHHYYAKNKSKLPQKPTTAPTKGTSTVKEQLSKELPPSTAPPAASAGKKSSSNTSQVKFSTFAETISHNRRDSVKIKEEQDFKKIQRLPTPPPETNKDIPCTCKPEKKSGIKKSVAIRA